MGKMRIGCIGLGTMGAPMAENLLKAGYELTVYNRTLSKADRLVAQGASLAHSPAELAKQSDVVFVNVSDSADVINVVLGEGGVIEGARPGMIVVDNSTIKPAASRLIYESMREKGVSCLDAPVSGGEIGAIDGTLTIMVGGDEEVWNACDRCWKLSAPRSPTLVGQAAGRSPRLPIRSWSQPKWLLKRSC